MEWDRLLFDPKDNIYAKIVAQAKRQFSSEVIQETIFNECLDKIQENSWHKLSAYEGASGASPSTYFCTIFSRMMIDEFRKRYGRCTVPSVFTKLGSEWTRLYRWVCCDNWFN
jgi:DNA-directed RNA polymerase specialized sigma24 family protein